MYALYEFKQGNGNYNSSTEVGVIYPLPENYMLDTRYFKYTPEDSRFITVLSPSGSINKKLK